MLDSILLTNKTQLLFMTLYLLMVSKIASETIEVKKTNIQLCIAKI